MVVDTEAILAMLLSAFLLRLPFKFTVAAGALPALFAASVTTASGLAAFSGFFNTSIKRGDLSRFTTLPMSLSLRGCPPNYRHGLEKIKTIGDAYLVAAGVPHHRLDHAESIAAMAIEMREAVRQFTRPEGLPLRLRIGTIRALWWLE